MVKKKKKSIIISRFTALLFLLGCLMLLFFSSDIIASRLSTQIKKPVPESTKTAFIISPTPTPRPSATPLPKPTAVPIPAGYCLFVPVLFYHHVQPQSLAVSKKQTSLSVDVGMFDTQMAYLSSRGYTTITAQQLVDALRTHSGVPSKSIVVTFDDGYKDNFDFAAPIVQKYGIHANLMVASGLLGGADYMSWDQVQSLKNQGWYLTDHTWSHYAVNHGTLDKIKFEIETAKQQIQDHTGQPVSIFTYPYGSYNSTALSVLQADGFTGAFTTNPGMYQCDSFILTLHRTRIGNAPLSSYGL